MSNLDKVEEVLFWHRRATERELNFCAYLRQKLAAEQTLSPREEELLGKIVAAVRLRTSLGFPVPATTYNGKHWTRMSDLLWKPASEYAAVGFERNK